MFFCKMAKYPPAESQCAQEVVSRIYVNHKTDTLTVFCALMKCLVCVGWLLS